MFSYPISSPTKVRQVNLFFYNIPSSGIGLPPAELFWSDANAMSPACLMSSLATRIWVRMIQLFEMSHWWSQRIRITLLITDSFVSTSHSQQRPA